MIELPFPPSVLGPNARPHWAQRARAFKRYKTECVAMLLPFKKQLLGRRTFKGVFHPPTAHRYDRDNLIARAKALQDALAVVAGVDDYDIHIEWDRGEPRRGGAVVVA